MDFSEWLVAARLKQDFTLDVLATKSKVSKTTVYMAEAGQTSPRLDTATKICKALGVPLWKALKQVEESRVKRPAKSRAK